MRWIKRIALTFLAVLLALFIYEAFQPPWKEQAKQTGIERLSRAGTLEEMKEAVDWLGAMIELPTGDWVAIYYTDRHGDEILSQAVALDSESRWYASDTHFCGHLTHRTREKCLPKAAELRRLRRSKDWPRKLNDGSLSMHDCIPALVASSTLDEARDFLAALRFQPLKTDAVPRLSGRVPPSDGE